MAFPETTWTILAQATLNGEESSQEALAQICEKYREPVDAAIRFNGVPEDRVQDVRQDFFLLLIKGSFFRKADREIGKFRTFLLKALKNFLVDEARRIKTTKRGGNFEQVELKDSSASSEDDELQFDLAWARALFHSVEKAVGEEIEQKRGKEQWAVLKSFLTDPAQNFGYKELGDSLNISEGAAKTEVSRMRAKFRERLRMEVKQTVSAPHEIDEELAYLRRAMSRMWGASDA